MNFNILPADIAANCNTKIVTDLSCRNLHAVTVRTVDDRDYYAQRSGAMAAVLDSGRIYITLPTIGNLTGPIIQYTYVISFEIFWENRVFLTPSEKWPKTRPRNESKIHTSE